MAKRKGKEVTYQEKCKLAKMAWEAVAARNALELALGHLRYEALRKLNPRQFAELNDRNLAGEFFDDMVDELVVRDNVT